MDGSTAIARTYDWSWTAFGLPEPRSVHPKPRRHGRLPQFGCGLAYTRTMGTDVTIEIPTGSLTLRSQLRLKLRRPTEKKPYVEQKVGDDLHRASGEWHRLERVINR